MNFGGAIIFGICVGASFFCIYRAMKDCMPEEHVSYKVPPIHPHPPMHQMSVEELLRYCDDLDIEKPNSQDQKEIIEYIKKQL